MKIRFACPGCDQPTVVRRPGPTEWQCPSCDHLLRLPPAPDSLSACPVCGGTELYKKKDFPHWLGLTILTVASVTFLVAQKFYLPGLAWAVLIGSALVDGGLYLWVGDAAVCYRCGAHVHGTTAVGGLAPFDLGTAERYRQERLRRDQLQQEKGVR